MKSIKFVFVLLFMALGIQAAFVALKDGKKGRITITDPTVLYDSTKTTFLAETKNGKYNLKKTDIEYLILEVDTLRFVGNVAQVIETVKKKEILSDEEISDESLVVESTNDNVKTIEKNDNTVIIGASNSNENSRIKKELEYNRKVTRTGAIVFGVGMGLQYGVAVPLTISAGLKGDQGLTITGAVVSLIAAGFTTSGPIRSGVGASMTFDSNRKYNFGMNKNINWGFYKAGWVISGISVALNLASSFDSSSANAMSIPLLFLGIASNAMFITSVATASGYTRSALNKVDDTAIKMDIVPVVSLHNKRIGMLLNFLF